ncbi:MAG: HlyD family secretion protein [Desulfobulbus sp.]|jgi:HlyD family secretion protein
MQDKKGGRWFIILIVAALAAGAGYYAWQQIQSRGPGSGFVGGNGRIEATEINISSKYGGRIDEVLVREGDFVKAGEPLVRMQIDTLNAQQAEAVAQKQQAITEVASARAQVAMRKSTVAAARADVARMQSELQAARRKLARTETLSQEGAASMQELDDDRARVAGALAQVDAAQARVVAEEAAVKAAEAQIAGAEARVQAVAATITRIETEIADSTLVSPKEARVQYRIAQPGEVVAAGAPVLNLIDLNDVYMSFFVPSTSAGRVALGSEVRIILDTAPDYAVPAKVSFVASSAQFTPKTVETASERQKLMFRVRAQIAPEWLRPYTEQIKTGVPGVAWIQLDSQARWPETLPLTVQ